MCCLRSMLFLFTTLFTNKKASEIVQFSTKNGTIFAQISKFLSLLLKALLQPHSFIPSDLYNILQPWSQLAARLHPYRRPYCGNCTETLLFATYPTIQRYRLNFYNILTSVNHRANLVSEVDGNYQAIIIEYQVSINDNFRHKMPLIFNKFQFF